MGTWRNDALGIKTDELANYCLKRRARIIGN
jgi:hypothetical protein